jgi:uncharacterized protein YbjT (DUF2867 family)
MGVPIAPQERGPILVTGSTGYVGGRLIPRLLALGHDVRVMVRIPGRLAHKAWLTQVEVVPADALSLASLARALNGVQSSYYLIHSMVGASGFHGRDNSDQESFK